MSNRNDTTTPSSTKFNDWISTVHAFSQLFRLPIGILAAIAGYATIYALNPATQLEQYLLVAFVLVSMNSAACAINDYWDLPQDLINHPERPLPSSRLSLQQAWWAAVVLFTCALIAAIPLGLYPFMVVVASTVLVWNYSHILSFSGILGNLIVAAIIASTIFLGSLVADRPFGMLHTIGFAFCYILVKQIIWDTYDAEGDRLQGIVTIGNSWGTRTAIKVAWALIVLLIVSIPVALFQMPILHPFLFAIFSSVMLLNLGMQLVCYQHQNSVSSDERFSLWERLTILLGLIGLLCRSCNIQMN
jgi:geranylgeranylglycerol-phosphate geranylgeranyltransferase